MNDILKDRLEEFSLDIYTKLLNCELRLFRFSVPSSNLLAYRQRNKRPLWSLDRSSTILNH